MTDQTVDAPSQPDETTIEYISPDQGEAFDAAAQPFMHATGDFDSNRAFIDANDNGTQDDDEVVIDAYAGTITLPHADGSSSVINYGYGGTVSHDAETYEDLSKQQFEDGMEVFNENTVDNLKPLEAEDAEPEDEDNTPQRIEVATSQ